MEQQPVAGTYKIKVPRKGKQRHRTATLEVRFAQVLVLPPKNQAAANRQPITRWAVWAQEIHAPTNVELISWMLPSPSNPSPKPAKKFAGINNIGSSNCSLKSSKVAVNLKNANSQPLTAYTAVSSSTSSSPGASSSRSASAANTPTFPVPCSSKPMSGRRYFATIIKPPSYPAPNRPSKR